MRIVDVKAEQMIPLPFLRHASLSPEEEDDEENDEEQEEEE